MRCIDINADLGESFGAYRMGADEQVVRWVSSVNIACGFHAGDPSVMRHTVALAKQAGVAAGAHPGLPDLAGFGRRWMEISPEEAYDLTVYQVGALAAFTRAAGWPLRHVKPHGALYNRAAADERLAEAIAHAVRDAEADLCLYALAGSRLAAVAERLGVRVAHEVFADRTYQPDGSLTPRRAPNALIQDEDTAVAQVLQMVREGRVRAVDGTPVPIRADTVCVHGDGPHAVAFAKRLREALEAEGITVQPPA
ncbi:MAG: LamB/YcsF family protein [Thermoflavifilum sp.]|nr:LamB/YcsF family protein [Thermoflavifilum sp.]MCL6514415.1 LamB/YcsF family protein [Alicyclobacillus sp.]